MKDPAFLFYSSDFLTGTMTLTDEQVGQYIRLLCLQHQKGELTEKDIIKVCGGNDEEIFSKFLKLETGKYVNERLNKEVKRRKEHSERQKLNIQKRWVKENNNETIPDSYQTDTKPLPLETETESVTETITEDEIITEKLNSEPEILEVDDEPKVIYEISPVEEMQEIFLTYNQKFKFSTDDVEPLRKIAEYLNNEKPLEHAARDAIADIMRQWEQMSKNVSEDSHWAGYTISQIFKYRSGILNGKNGKSTRKGSDRRNMEDLRAIANGT